MLLGFGRLLTGMGVVHGEEADHLVVGVILHPAVGISHLRDAGHTVIGVSRDAAVGLCHHRLIVHQVIIIGDEMITKRQS